MNRILDRIISYATSEKGLIGLSLWRISMGLCLIYWYLSNYLNRHYLWGPNGVISHEQFLTFGHFSLYAFNPSPIYFELIFHLGIVVAILFTLGWRTRIVALANYIFHYSLYVRNNLMGTGGDNLIMIVQFYLLFANTAAYFSLDAGRQEQKNEGVSERSVGRQILGGLHNAVLLAAVLQLCTVYMTAGMHKISGEMWNSGTAMYYVMRIREYTSPPWIYRNAYLVVLLSYTTIFFQIGFFFSLFNRVTRILWILAGISFHAGIALFMGLFTFSWYIVSVYPLLISDGEYRRAHLALKEWINGKRVQVFYDGWCPACIRSVKLWRALDFLSVLDFISFRNPDVAQKHGLEMAAVVQRIHTKEATSGRIKNGIDSIIQITSRLMVLWPLLPALWLARQLGLGEPVYDWIADHRFILSSVSRCPGADCDITTTSGVSKLP